MKRGKLAIGDVDLMYFAFTTVGSWEVEKPTVVERQLTESHSLTTTRTDDLALFTAVAGRLALKYHKPPKWLDK